MVYVVAISPFRPWPDLVSKIPDDASYYFQIGRNYADGKGLTFDGRNPTNGFQPLWQMLIVIMQQSLPFRQQPEQFVRAVLVLQGIILTAALVVFNRTLRLLGNPLLRGLGILLFLTAVYLIMRDGMESALLVALAVMVVYFQARNGQLDRWSRRRCLGFGILLGGVLLARLDSIFWIGGLFAVLVLMTGNGEERLKGIRFRKASWIGFACAAVVIPYLMANYLAFGHLMPISGALKTSFPKMGYYVSEFTLLPDTRLLLALSLILSVACLLWELGPWPRGQDGPLRGPVCAIALGVLLHVGYAVLFMKWAVFSWHFVLERFAVCLLLPYLCAKIALFISPVVQRWAIGAMVTVLACAVPLVVLQRDWHSDLSRSWKMTSYQASQWVKTNLPANAVIAMKDAGNMGFYSDRPVVNLDGLVNSFAYQDALKDGRFREFLRNSGVNYFVQHAIWDDPAANNGDYVAYTVRSYSHLYDRPGGDLQLKRSDEVYRSPTYYDGPHKTELVIWKIPPEDLAD
ncbi:hypothetical protein BayCH28_28390 [Mycolicibacterium sp. CH28]|uniref:hypothetical protein n=1 Tax=Mycolicibacterium sp. CH28 TaxID=2512237 RepID=UPI00108211FE|nr:hypothetical protein [Mycolicibacterium sp. CH28]TGD83794.1 hypothetical protein BayCH28_28390 [Mycolicibacterium sp. CH28]